MAYTLKQVTIRTKNTEEGLKKIGEVWQDIMTGEIPVLFDSEHTFQQGISPVSKYSNYESDYTGYYDLSIIGMTPDFFQTIEMEAGIGLYKKYDETDETGDVSTCTKQAWENVWSDEKSGIISRAYTEDYESSIPAEYSKDGKAHCCLYIALKQKS